MSTVEVAAQAAIVTTFAVSVWGKVRSRWEYAEFRDSLPGNLGIPRRLAGPVAATVVTAEALAALVLAVGALGLGAVAWVPALVLLTALTIALGRMIRRGVRASCRCFGRADRPPGRLHLVRNGLLLLIAVGGAAVATGTPAAVWGSGAFVAAAAGSVGALVLVSLEDLVALARPLRVGGQCMEKS